MTKRTARADFDLAMFWHWRTRFSAACMKSSSGAATATAGARYESVGEGYALTRREDLDLAERILAALGAARTVVNVGAGRAPTSRVTAT
jgi:hypothetical protein